MKIPKCGRFSKSLFQITLDYRTYYRNLIYYYPKTDKITIVTSWICQRYGMVPRFKRWTEGEIKFIKNNYSVYSVSDLAEKLDRTRSSIANCAKHLKLRKPTINKSVKTLSKYDAGFIAGCIDSDGFLGFYKGKQRNPQNIKWVVTVGITNNDFKLIATLKEIIGVGCIHREKITKNAPVFRLTLSSRMLRGLLPQIKLIRKEKQRQLLLEALDLLQWHTKDHTPNHERLEEIRQEMKILNMKREKQPTR